MIIEYKEYKLKQIDHGFDLYKTTKAQKVGDGTIKEPKGDFYEREENTGYNMSLENGIKKIIHLEESKNESICDLEKFMELHDQTQQNVKQLCINLLNLSK